MHDVKYWLLLFHISKVERDHWETNIPDINDCFVKLPLHATTRSTMEHLWIFFCLMTRI